MTFIAYQNYFLRNFYQLIIILCIKMKIIYGHALTGNDITENHIVENVSIMFIGNFTTSYVMCINMKSIG